MYVIFIIAFVLYLTVMSTTFATTFCNIFQFDSRFASMAVNVIAILIPCGLTLLMIIMHRSLWDIAIFEIILTVGLVLINLLLKLLTQPEN